MKNTELQALRKLLFLDIKEASVCIAGHATPRTWQKYEKGDVPIPDDVAIKIMEIIDRRNLFIEGSLNLIDEKGADDVTVNFYRYFDDYLTAHPDADIIEWRLSQSVAASLLASGDAVFLEM